MSHKSEADRKRWLIQHQNLTYMHKTIRNLFTFSQPIDKIFFRSKVLQTKVLGKIITSLKINIEEAETERAVSRMKL